MIWKSLFLLVYRAISYIFCLLSPFIIVNYEFFSCNNQILVKKQYNYQ